MVISLMLLFNKKTKTRLIIARIQVNKFILVKKPEEPISATV